MFSTNPLESAPKLVYGTCVAAVRASDASTPANRFDMNGHLQAVGRDARGRKQDRYHTQYREVRDQAKFSRMVAFGTVFAIIRRQVEKGLRRPGLPRRKCSLPWFACWRRASSA